MRSNYYTVPIQSVKYVWLLVLLFQLSAGLDHCFIAIDQLWKIDLGIRIICSVSSMWLATMLKMDSARCTKLISYLHLWCALTWLYLSISIMFSFHSRLKWNFWGQTFFLLLLRCDVRLITILLIVFISMKLKNRKRKNWIVDSLGLHWKVCGMMKQD